MNAIGAQPDDWDKHFKLMADIDLSDYDGRGGRPAFHMIGYSRRWPDHKPFMGFFDANGHRILNFKYRSEGQDYVGLFGYVGFFTGSIKPEIGIRNLGLVNPTVNAGTRRYVGALVGQFRDAAITSCYVEGGNVSGGACVGGLIGGSIDTGRQSYEPFVIVEKCHASANVSGTDTVGGLIGLSSGSVQACYSTGKVIGTRDVGGLIGFATSMLRLNPDKEQETIASFWDTQASGQTSSGEGTGKTTVEMHTAGTFFDAGWDFVGETANGAEDIWRIDERRDYPRLWWEAATE